jgi:hypothetical protein
LKIKDHRKARPVPVAPGLEWWITWGKPLDLSTINLGKPLPPGDVIVTVSRPGASLGGDCGIAAQDGVAGTRLLWAPLAGKELRAEYATIDR